MSLSVSWLDLTTLHSLLSVLDLGGSEHLLQSIYDAEAAAQRPATLGKQVDEVPVITEENWTTYLGKEMYVAFLHMRPKKLTYTQCVRRLSAVLQ